ncbi:MAG: hypothetical protein L0H53_06590 [Candidatus Nitrosocosmicus sp.]|nr:hypothetical protein [Candidatus Nitrosocosmicus sp.]
MHLVAAVYVNINDSKEYYMITSEEIYNLFKNLTPNSLGSNDFTIQDNDDLNKDTSNISDLLY